MEQDFPIISVSVRNMVEFILRSGDINTRMGAKSDADAMQMGSRIHRKIQKNMGVGYHAEVSLKREVPCDGFVLRVEGRADGIIEEDSGITIDEIKGVLWEIGQLEEPVAVHLAQAKCYAAIYAEKAGLKKIKVQMTYCQMDTEEIRRFSQEYEIGELEAWFQGVVREYEKWAAFQVNWKQVRDRSVENIEFPYSYRDGQKEIAVSVYKTILREKNLFVQAPTGVGKTMGTVFPSVKAMGEKITDKIFYLTAKTITRTVAEQAFDTLRKQDLKLKTITLTAKEKICFCEKTQCDPDNCPYAKGHFDRVNDALFEMINWEDALTREVICDYAQKYQVCPFELSLDASLFSDTVICDYNYVFDPNAHLQRFFTEGAGGKYLFLVDEAHNLVERGREMYSAQLYKEDFLELKKKVGKNAGKLIKALDTCNKILLQYKRECEDFKILDNLSILYLRLLNVMTELEAFRENCEEALREQVAEFYFAVRSFVNIYERLDENYVCYSQMTEDGRFKVKLYCVNPAANLQEFLDIGRSTIFFSATLLPIQYYKKLLSTEKDNYAIGVRSPFEQSRRLIVNGIDVSTRYKMRTSKMYRKYAEYLMEMVSARPGNYMAFFPSYKFMGEVFEEFIRLPEHEKTECILQGQYMKEEEREEFLHAFKNKREGSLIGFCIMGGIFSEGIDLDEEKLIGAAVVGTGIPQVCLEREILRNHFDKEGVNGFDYAYLFPGINKVLQAAGRVIRTEEDRGVILLLDERFREKRCREMLPTEWNDCQTVRFGEIGGQMKAFWKRQK